MYSRAAEATEAARPCVNFTSVKIIHNDTTRLSLSITGKAFLIYKRTMSKNSDIRGTAWSVTINNPTDKDEEEIALARQKGWRVEGQIEVGANGTPHYQLLVKTPQVRWKAVTKAFARGHVELARNVAALETYVNKEATRVGVLPQTSDRYPSLSKLWDLFAEWLESHPKYKYEWLDLSGDDWLPVFDRFVRDKIEEGYHIETMAVNPQIRSSIKNYGYSIIIRSKNNKNSSIDRQTDRQTDDESEDMFAVLNRLGEVVSSGVDIPTLDQGGCQEN